ncbi:MAG TPA: MBL fold metallo-hydrolase [Casimicrobiaceae bacterium]|nr:MBL fold metallo-hydrolase [Casimicrobiaceae bacterium]
MSSLHYPITTPPAPGETLEIAPGISWLRMPLPFALDHINLWLLREGERLTLVDTGYGDAITRTLWETHLARAKRGLERIVVTHYHPDHVGNAAWLSQRLGVSVTMTAAEFLTAHAVHGEAPGHAVADIGTLFRAHGVAEEHLAGFAARGNRYHEGVAELPAHFDRILPGSNLRLAGTDWRVITGFGHSPEHAALYSQDRRVLISGDMLLPRISTNVSVWPSEPLANALARFLRSIGDFDALPADTLVLPSHGLPFRGIGARVAALREHHTARLEELVDAVTQSSAAVSAADLVPVLFRRELDLQQRFFAIGEAIAHLNYLAGNGTLTRTTSQRGAVRFELAGSAVTS